MARIPLFLHSPASDSVLQALAFIEESESFHLHTLKMDSDLFGLMIDVRPCLAIFSIRSPEEVRRVCSLLETFRLVRTAQGYPSRDPTLRIILVAEERAVAIERWHELGVHEFIIAPILPRALAYKVQRHYQRASISKIPDPMREKTDDVVVISGKSPEPVMDIPYFSVSSPLLPVGETEEFVHFAPPPSKEQRLERETGFPQPKYKIIASVPELNESEGRWEKSGDGERDWSWTPVKDKATDKSWSYRGERPVFDRKRGGWRFSGEAPELRARTKNEPEERKLITVQETPQRKEIVVHDDLDVQEIDETSYSRNPVTQSRKSDDPTTRSLNEERPASFENEKSTQTRERPEEIRKQKRFEQTATENSRGTEKNAGTDDHSDSPSSSWTHRAESSSSEEGEETRSDARQDSDFQSTRAGARTLVTERARERTWHSRSGKDAVDPVSESDLSPDFHEAGEVTQIANDLNDPADSLERDTQTQTGSELGIQSSSFPSREKQSAESPSTSWKTATASVEHSRDPATQNSAPNPDMSEEKVAVAENTDSLENDPLIKRLEEALGGKSEFPVENLADPTLLPEADNEKPRDVRPYPGFREATFRTGPSFSSSASDSRELSGRFGTGQKPEGDLKVKGSGDDNTNTWSMQNLDESETLGHGKLKREADSEAGESSPSSPETPLSGSGPQSPMDPAEKARLLKSIYANLKFGGSGTGTSPSDPEKAASGFFGQLLEAIRKLLK